jgi:hypothetical protein
MAASETGRLGSHDRPSRREVRPHGGAQPSRGQRKEALGWNFAPGRNFDSGQGRIEELRPRGAVSNRMRLRPLEKRDVFRTYRSFGSGSDGTTGTRWETAKTRTGATLLLRSKTPRGQDLGRASSGFLRVRARHRARPPFRGDKRVGTPCVPYELGGSASPRAWYGKAFDDSERTRILQSLAFRARMERRAFPLALPPRSSLTLVSCRPWREDALDSQRSEAEWGAHPVRSWLL